LLFEEPTIEPQEDSISPKYDAFDGISYSFDAAGQRVPYVTQAWITFGTQTGTGTRMREDEEDTDSFPYLAGTQTVTKIRGETTDVD
jgi:hypothetical protein